MPWRGTVGGEPSYRRHVRALVVAGHHSGTRSELPYLGGSANAGDGTLCPVDHMDYHMVMTRREVLVQLDDELVELLDSLAADLGTNRSELLRRGAQAVLEAEELASKDRQLQAGYRRQPADPALVASARRLAARTAPAW